MPAATMNPYHNFAFYHAHLTASGQSLPLGGIPAPDGPRPAPDAPAVMIFSPHPDDECLVGGLALRLMRQSAMRIVNVAVTLGSNRARRAARLEELSNACNWLGLELQTAAPDGLEKINFQARSNEPERWKSAVKTIASLLLKHRPRAIFFPHELDWNSTHIGTHFLVMDALNLLPPGFECLVIETEYWAPMASPNLMIELSVEDVADLLAALSFHVGEVRRNPYHLRMPAWLQDNVRRGAELIGGQGEAAPDFPFATLYRLRRWKNGCIEDVFDGGRQIRAAADPGKVLGLAQNV